MERRVPRPCKRCAASARKKSCSFLVDRSFEFPRGDNSFRERFEARIAAQSSAKKFRSFILRRHLLAQCDCQRLLNILDFYDTALGFLIIWIFHHGDIKVFLAFTESDVGCAIAGSDLEDV